MPFSQGERPSTSPAPKEKEEENIEPVPMLRSVIAKKPKPKDDKIGVGRMVIQACEQAQHSISEVKQYKL